MYTAQVLSNANCNKSMVKMYLSMRWVVDVMWSVCLKHIINDQWYKNWGDDPNNETERIVKTAAKLIVSEMRNQTFDCGYYPHKNIYILCSEKHRLVDSESEAVHGFVCFLLDSTGKHWTMYNTSNTPTVNFPTNAAQIGSWGESCISVVIADQSSLGCSFSSNEVTRYKESVIENENFPIGLKGW